ncbi:MAG: metal-sensing transcriptional repressor [Armatimonadota bacterium]
MVEDHRAIAAIVIQLSVVRNAVDRVGFMILSYRMIECLDKSEAEDKLNHVMNMFLMLS